MAKSTIHAARVKRFDRALTGGQQCSWYTGRLDVLWHVDNKSWQNHFQSAPTSVTPALEGEHKYILYDMSLFSPATAAIVLTPLPHIHTHTHKLVVIQPFGQPCVPPLPFAPAEKKKALIFCSAKEREKWASHFPISTCHSTPQSVGQSIFSQSAVWGGVVGVGGGVAVCVSVCLCHVRPGRSVCHGDTRSDGTMKPMELSLLPIMFVVVVAPNNKRGGKPCSGAFGVLVCVCEWCCVQKWMTLVCVYPMKLICAQRTCVVSGWLREYGRLQRLGSQVKQRKDISCQFACKAGKTHNVVFVHGPCFSLSDHFYAGGIASGTL